MRLFRLLISLLFPLLVSSCCTPECCCPGCTSCTNPITSACNSYSCTSYSGQNCGSYVRLFSPSRLQTVNVPSTVYVANNGHQMVVGTQQGGCNCKGGQPVATECICPVSSNQQGTVVAISGTGTRIVHKESCYGYDYCLLGLPGWVTIICSILLLLIFIILLFYCISCLVHYLII